MSPVESKVGVDVPIMSPGLSASSPSGEPWSWWWRSNLSALDWSVWSSWSATNQVFWIQGWAAHGHPSPTSFWSAHADGRPLWMAIMSVGAHEALESLLAVATDVTALGLNQRDRSGRGWCHLAILNAVPDSLAIAGLALLDNSWVNPDDRRLDAPSLLPRPNLAMAMARRFWMDSTRSGRTRQSTQAAFSHWALVAHTAGRPDLERIWTFWGRGGASPFFA